MLHLCASHLMRTPVPTISVAILMLVGCSPTGSGPLSFQTPTDWRIEHKTSGEHEFYTVTAKTPNGGLLMIYQWPAPSRPEEIPALVQKIADGFLEQVKRSSDLKLTSEEYRVEQFAGEHCRGSFAAFQVASNGTNTVQTMFVMSVDGGIWFGQFTGPSDAWKKALTVLRGIEKNG